MSKISKLIMVVLMFSGGVSYGSEQVALSAESETVEDSKKQNEGRRWLPLPWTDALESEVRVNEPVDVGMRKQLFLDKYIVDSADEVLFTMMSPSRYEGNPVMTPDSPSDGQIIYPGTVRWNAEKGVFQLWYISVHFINDKEVHYNAYAESKDGIQWDRPSLGLYEFNGSKLNNLIKMGGWNTIYDEHDPEPGRRYKTVGSGGDARSVNIYYSSDGITEWSEMETNPVIVNTGDTHSLLDGGWSGKLGKYVGFFRPMGKRPHSLVRQQRREIGVSFSDDAENWSPLVTVLAPDKHDATGTEFYRVCVIPYEDYFIGLLSVLHMDSEFLDFYQPDPVGMEQTVDVQLVVSRDAVNWKRVGNRAPWLALGNYQSWDDLTIWATNPLIVNDEIRMYYGGASVRHQLADLRGVMGKTFGRSREGAIGLVTLRLDGWVAARPNGRRDGTLITRSLLFDGSRLEINANAEAGELLVELVDVENRPIEGFSGERAYRITGDSVRHHVNWRRSLVDLKGQPVRLKFSMRGKVELYAFQFTE